MPAYAVMHTSTGAAGIQLWIFVFFISSPEDEFGLFITGQGSPPGPFFIFKTNKTAFELFVFFLI